MSWQRKKTTGKNKSYSLTRELRSDNKSNDQFEVMLNNLSLEEIIALKLELSAKVAGGFIWYTNLEKHATSCKRRAA